MNEPHEMPRTGGPQPGERVVVSDGPRMGQLGRIRDVLMEGDQPIGLRVYLDDEVGPVDYEGHTFGLMDVDPVSEDRPLSLLAKELLLRMAAATPPSRRAELQRYDVLVCVGKRAEVPGGMSGLGSVYAIDRGLIPEAEARILQVCLLGQAIADRLNGFTPLLPQIFNGLARQVEVDGEPELGRTEAACGACREWFPVEWCDLGFRFLPAEPGMPATGLCPGCLSALGPRGSLRRRVKSGGR